MRKFVVAVALLGVAAAGQASAHARLLHAFPRVGDTVAHAPPELRLWFSERIEATISSVSMTGPDGRLVPIGGLALDPQDRREVVVGLPVAMPPGAYHVRWWVTSADTHRTEGDFIFRVKP